MQDAIPFVIGFLAAMASIAQVVQLMMQISEKASNTKTRATLAALLPGLRKKAAFAVALGIGSMAFCLYGFYRTTQIVREHHLIQSYGLAPDPVPGQRLRMSVMTKDIDHSRKIGFVAFHNFGTEMLDLTDLQKSPLYDVTVEEVNLLLTVDEKFLQAVRQGATGTIYVLLSFPPGVSMKSFTTLREAYAVGIVNLDGRTGPP